MASNFFGELFRISTFGESHGAAIGVVIDGCPAGLPLAKEEIDLELSKRRPGQARHGGHTSARQESDEVEILSGLYQGKTSGAPIALLIRNRDADPAPYREIEKLYRPGHANFTYLAKYGIFDPRGGGRASARETAARVAAGAIAKKFLRAANIDCVAFIQEIGGIEASVPDPTDLSLLPLLRRSVEASPLFCHDPEASIAMEKALSEVAQEGDSLGGIVGCLAHLPKGLGDPIYGKLEARLAFALLSLPASKGFEIGAGFGAARMRGSEHNDPFGVNETGEVVPQSNNAGGTLGGISTGAPLSFRVPFKPTSSIKKRQQTASLAGELASFQIPEKGRHDPCVAIRAVPVVEAMTALVLADALLMQRLARI